MMRTVTNRIDKLEDRLGIAAAKRPCTAVVISLAGWEYALNNDRCVEILRESGFLPDGVIFVPVDLCGIPDGLNAEELEKFLRERGGEICGSGGAARAGVTRGAPVK
jgi:fermentation-respiration switch protein FrsA (DUF1100 family)